MLTALRRGLALALPLIIVGAVALLILNLPIPQLQNSLTDVFGEHWRRLCQLVQQGSFSIAALAVLICTSASYAKAKDVLPNRQKINPRVTSVVCLSCYFVIAVPMTGDLPREMFSLGSGGFPIALCIAIIGTPIFLFFLRYLHVSNFFHTKAVDSDYHDALSTVPAAMATIFLFGLLRLFLQYEGLDNLNIHAQSLFAAPFQNAKPDLTLGVGFIGMSQGLWFFGVHGPNLLSMVESHILIPSLMENIAAVGMGATPHNILTKPFLDAFVHIGGSGATLSLILAILIRGKDISSRRLAMVAFLPALFNVNEIILFGLPLVLNPIYAIPFLLAPIAQLLVAYAVTAAGLVPVTLANIHWTSPPLLGGYAATGSITGAMLQILCLGTGILAYLPFVQLANTMHLRSFKKSLDILCHTVAETAPPFGNQRCLDLPGQAGQLARTLAFDLVSALKNDDQISLEYQPQINVAQGRPIGAEALLRWRHPVYGPIPPHVAVALAEEAEVVDRLGLLVLSKACRQQVVLLENGFSDTVISVNMSATQFNDKTLPEKVRDTLQRTGLPPHLLKIEVTETMALSPDEQSIEILGHLREMGVLVAIDDFGMGHTSLRYLKEFPVETIKIDRSLTQESADGINDHIIHSIVSLCEALGIQIIVEGVETEAQLRRFQAHRCNIFQGFLFSKPLSADAYIDYFFNNSPLKMAANQ